MNSDFAEMLSAFSAAGVEYLVVGAHAVAVHGRPRATGDLGLWVRPSAENAARVWNALTAFGAPLDRLDPEDLVSDDLIFQIGVVPGRIDILTSIGSTDFERAWQGRVPVELWGITVPVIGREELIQAKREAGRPRDLADIEALEGRDG